MEQRRCAHPGCDAVLSRYNTTTLCAIHERERLLAPTRPGPAPAGPNVVPSAPEAPASADHRGTDVVDSRAQMELRLARADETWVLLDRDERAQLESAIRAEIAAHAAADAAFDAARTARALRAAASLPSCARCARRVSAEVRLVVHASTGPVVYHQACWLAEHAPDEHPGARALPERPPGQVRLISPRNRSRFPTLSIPLVTAACAAAGRTLDEIADWVGVDAVDLDRLPLTPARGDVTSGRDVALVLGVPLIDLVDRPPRARDDVAPGAPGKVIRRLVYEFARDLLVPLATLEERTGLEPGTLARYLRGEIEMTGLWAVRAADVLGLRPGTIAPGLAGFGPPPARTPARCADVPGRLARLLTPDPALSDRHHHNLDTAAELLGTDPVTVAALAAGAAEPIWPLTAALAELTCP